MSDAQQPPGNDAGLTPPAAVLASAEALVNRLLALDPEGAAVLTKVQGRVLRVELIGVGLQLHLVPEANALRLFGDYATEPDCIVRATPAALLAMALAEHREDEVFSGAVSIDGDNRVAQMVGDALKGLDIDWEEQLAKLAGDTLAHRIGHQARATGRWASRSGEVLTRDLREYLIEEGRLVPNAAEMKGFLDGVDTLRDDVDRLEARIARLHRHTSGGQGSA